MTDSAQRTSDGVVVTIWTIYYSPRDYPGLFVLRGHDILAGRTQPRSECFTATTLDEIRDRLPPYSVQLSRDPHDDPVIVEIWI